MATQLMLDTRDLKTVLPRIAEKYMGIPIERIEYLGGGSNGKAFCLQLANGNNVVLKAFRVTGMNEAEAYQLKILADNTCVKMPQVLFTHSEEKFSILGMSYISGKNVLNPLFVLKNKSLKKQFAQDVVKGMLDWHNVKGDKYGYVENPTYISWHNFYRENKVEKVLADLQKLVQDKSFNVKKYDLLCYATEKYDNVFEEPEHPVLIHGDLNIMNIMADPKTFSLTGFIDPCGTMWADREYDLFQLQNMWGNSFGLYKTYKSFYKMSKNSDFRVVYYGTINEVSCRFGGGLVVPLWEDLWFSRLKKFF